MKPKTLVLLSASVEDHPYLLEMGHLTFVCLISVSDVKGTKVRYSRFHKERENGIGASVQL